MNVALYLRMSSDKQELSIAQQEAELRRLCERKAYRIAAVYRDEGISGDNFERRRGFRKLLDDAGKGIFCRVLAWDQDRLGRHDSLMSGAVLMPLRKHGIVIETIGQGELDLESFAGRVTFTVQQESKHQFLRDLSRNVARGHAAKAEAADGYVGSPGTYGYTRDTQLVGRRRVSRLVIHPAQAAVVRRIFAEYLKPDSSFAKIAEMLNASKVPTPRGPTHWEGDSVRYIIRNPVYTGRLVYGRRPTGKYSRRTDEGIVSLRPGIAVKAAPPIVRKAPDIVPPIIDEATFDKVHELIAERRGNTRRHGTIHKLSGLIICGNCGRRYHGDKGSYRCSSAKLTKKPGRCAPHRVSEAPLIDTIDELLRKHFGTPALASRLRRKIEQRFAADKADAAGEAPALRKRLAALDRQLADGTARLLVIPAGMVPELAKALDAVRSERDSLAGRLERANAKPAAEAAPKVLVERMAAMATDFAKAAKAGDPALVNHCLRRMGVEIAIVRNTAAGAEAEVRLLPVGDSLRSRDRAQQVNARHLLVKNVTLPPRNPPGFRPGNKFGRGLPSDKARAASLVYWNRRRREQHESAGKASRRRRPAPAASRRRAKA
jgi:site-specific DNA recombinase